MTRQSGSEFDTNRSIYLDAHFKFVFHGKLSSLSRLRKTPARRLQTIRAKPTITDASLMFKRLIITLIGLPALIKLKQFEAIGAMWPAPWATKPAARGWLRASSRPS